MTNYNGWTNYATWRVNLEIFDGVEISECFSGKPDLRDLADWAKEYVTEIVEIDTKAGLALDYARAFLSDVNWHEIAQHMLENWEEEEEEEEAA